MMNDRLKTGFREKYGADVEFFKEIEVSGKQVGCFLTGKREEYSPQILQKFDLVCCSMNAKMDQVLELIEQTHDNLVAPVYQVLFAMEPDFMEEQFPGTRAFEDITSTMTVSALELYEVHLSEIGNTLYEPKVMGKIRFKSGAIDTELVAIIALDGNLLKVQTQY